MSSRISAARRLPVSSRCFLNETRCVVIKGRLEKPIRGKLNNFQVLKMGENYFTRILIGFLIWSCFIKFWAGHRVWHWMGWIFLFQDSTGIKILNIYIYIYMYRINCNINIHRDMCLILNTCAIVQTLGVACVFVDFSCVPSVGISQVCRQTHLGKMLSREIDDACYLDK